EMATLGPGAVAQNKGDADKAMASATTKVEATYQVPFLAHAAMEPMNCTVHVRKDGCEVWVGSQVLARAQAAAAKAAGLPLAVNELINYLWDEGVLVAQEAGRWKLARALREVEVPEDLDELIRLRIRRLPNSTRRLASLAAILGQIFEVQLLQEAADEHAKVVEIGLEILLKRWLIRHFAYFWTDGRGDEEPLAAWTRGARRGSFEFAHNRTRRAIYEELNPLRRQAMHAQIAASLEKLRGGRDCEALAFHYTVANQWEKALPHLQRSIERALAVGAEEAARRYCDQAIEGLSRLAAGARSEAAAERWREERDVMRERVAKLWP
ncbi:MAG TPA: molybdopterin cofactor-binding domain-containing protein, partial [Thermoanaerobaculia bacterium]